MLIVLFFIIASLWCLMLYYTVGPWLMSAELPRNKNLDISYLTIPLLAIYLLNTATWFSIYVIYPFVSKKVINHQLMLIKRKRHSRAFYKPRITIIIPARNEENVIRKTVINC